MKKNLLVVADLRGSPEKLEKLLARLAALGKAERIQTSAFLLSTNVTLRGVRSYLRQALDDNDGLCVAQTTIVAT